MASCPNCQGDSFRVGESETGPVLACAGCGRVFGAVPEARFARLEQELRQLREELARLRQAVNFLNQRVR
jgi:hypothetical protein